MGLAGVGEWLVTQGLAYSEAAGRERAAALHALFAAAAFRTSVEIAGALGGEVSGEEFTLRLSPDASATTVQISGNSQPKQLASARAAFQSRHDIVGLGRSLLFERLSQASPSRPCP